MKNGRLDWTDSINEEWQMSVPELCAEIRSRVSALDAGQYYGLQVNRAGYTRCVWHDERTGSLRLYDAAHGGGCHCFGCNRSADTVGLVAQVLHVSMMDAIRALDADFNLNLPLRKTEMTPQEMAARRERERQVEQARKAAQALEEWRKREIMRLADAIQMANNLPPTPDAWTPHQLDALRHREANEYRLECIQNADTAELMEFYRDAVKKVSQ